MAYNQQQKGPRVSPDNLCYNCNEFGDISTFCAYRERKLPNVSTQFAQCGQPSHHGHCDLHIAPTRNTMQPPPGANRGLGLPHDGRSRGAGNGPRRSASVRHKLESTMMLGDDQQEQDDQVEPVLVWERISLPNRK